MNKAHRLWLESELLTLDELLSSKLQSSYCEKERFIYRNVYAGTLSIINDSGNIIKKEDLATKLIRKCDIVLDRLWELINTGHWKDVDVFLRQFYRVTSILKALNLQFLGQLKAAVLSCDMGIILGAPFGKEELIQEIGSIIHSNNNRDDDFGRPGKQQCINIIVPNFNLPNGLQEKTIARVDSPSIEHFISVIASKEPVIIENSLGHWPALSKWNMEYLIRNFGGRTVPVEIGSSYTSSSWSQKLITIREFIETYIHDENTENKAYLAQYELFEHLTELKKDIVPLDYCAVSDGEVIANCWFGPKDTVSPLHHDHYQNIFCQVYGYKRFILFNSDEDMHPHFHRLLHNTSQVDLESDTVLDDFPDLSDKTAWVGNLGPGDILYIPLHWWHHVKSFSPSLSVSFWWKSSI